MNPSQDRQYPVSDNRDIFAGSGNTRTIIVQDRARIVLGVTQNQIGFTVNDVIGNLENELSKNGDSKILSVAIARNNSEIATATLDRGIWQTNAGLHLVLGGAMASLNIWGRRCDNLMAIMLTIGQSEPIIINYFINAAPQNERPIQAFIIGNLDLAIASIEGAPAGTQTDDYEIPQPQEVAGGI